eukprot:CAMPEP_0179064062 /NCGR_PEP_ID=MMETSP0796-20121207/27756_1 /TAXON_ID=73915 /ORGANISM="Pyrodinium bahamense, Strain pbaha01" /LENGTH=68 /DNA_ID=CAMNT_0020761001 /DNA_START=14 /DNA_END=216 /DNA_ORIENTATION=-
MEPKDEVPLTAPAQEEYGSYGGGGYDAGGAGGYEGAAAVSSCAGVLGGAACGPHGLGDWRGAGRGWHR